MKVTATKAGFYERLHKPGDEFEISEEKFSESWMKRKAGRPPKADKPKYEAVKQEEAEKAPE